MLYVLYKCRLFIIKIHFIEYRCLKHEVHGYVYTVCQRLTNRFQNMCTYPTNLQKWKGKLLSD